MTRVPPIAPGAGMQRLLALFVVFFSHLFLPSFFFFPRQERKPQRRTLARRRADGVGGMRDVFPAMKSNLSATSRRTNTPLKSQCASRSVLSAGECVRCVRCVRPCVRARVHNLLRLPDRSPAAPAGRQLLLVTALGASGQCESARSSALVPL